LRLGEAMYTLGHIYFLNNEFEIAKEVLH